MIGDPERHARIVSGLANAKLDALICSSATEVLLLTGYWPVMANSIAVQTLDGVVAVIVPEDEIELAQQASSARTIPYKPAGLDTLASPAQNLKEPLGSLLNELGLTTSNCGLRMNEGFQPSSYAVGYEFRSVLAELLGGLLPGATFAQADSLIESLLAVKTSKELTLIKRACAVTAVAFDQAASVIQPGLCETEVAAALQSAFETAPAAKQFLRSYGYFFCMSGPNSAKAAAAYARTRQRVLQEGDLVMIHANTCGDGYWTDVTRTYTVGKSVTRHEQMRAAIFEARTAGLRAILPGAIAREVDSAVRTVMEKHGMGHAFKHAAGHGVGFAAANPNGRPRIHPLSDDVLEPGMTFNLEPAAYFDGYGGMRHCDVVAVASNGVEVLTDF